MQLLKSQTSIPALNAPGRRPEHRREAVDTADERPVLIKTAHSFNVERAHELKACLSPRMFPETADIFLRSRFGLILLFPGKSLKTFQEIEILDERIMRENCRAAVVLASLTGKIVVVARKSVVLPAYLFKNPGKAVKMRFQISVHFHIPRCMIQGK
jgi:hypothetical protein